MGNVYTVNDLQRLLAARHVKDFYVSECKDGPTWSGTHLRLDGWALRKSWSKPLVTAYEIKISRGDFMADDKWQYYLPLCNEFYFVAPAGVIKASELPEAVGLLTPTKNVTRLMRRKRPAYREVVVPEELYRYILMSRVMVTRSRHSGEGNETEFWRSWLEGKDASTYLGHAVSRKIRRLVESRIDAVGAKNRELTDLMKQYDEIRQVLTDLEIEPSQVCGVAVDVGRKLAAAVPYSVSRATGRLRQALDVFDKALLELAPEGRADHEAWAAQGARHECWG